MSGVRDTDKGYKSLMRRLKKDQPTLKVGVYGAKADIVHTDSGVSVGELSEIHEFGLGNVPERSWLRGYVDENNSRIVEMIRRLAGEVTAGRMQPEQALNLLGLKLVGEIQVRMPHLLPELEEATKKRKGSSATLVDTGQLRGSVSHEVVPPGAT